MNPPNPAPESVRSSLLDVPQNRTRLSMWKERNGIIVYDTRFEDDPARFMATSRAILDSYAGSYGVNKGDSLSKAWWHVGRLLKECNQIGYGPDEESACFALAEAQRLPWLESIQQSDLTK